MVSHRLINRYLYEHIRDLKVPPSQMGYHRKRRYLLSIINDGYFKAPKLIVAHFRISHTLLLHYMQNRYFIRLSLPIASVKFHNAPHAAITFYEILFET